MTGEWFHNGEAMQTAPVEDRGFQYGDGLFETVAIRHGKPISCKGEDGKWSVAMCLATQRSIETGRTVTMKEIVAG